MENISETKEFVEENAQDAPVKDIHWHANQVDAESQTHLEDDAGEGGAAIIRAFDFAANPEAFNKHQPTAQELFNHHLKGIEVMLWRDGMKVMTEVPPRLLFNKKKNKYRIFVGAAPQKGHILTQRPKTLSQIAHGN